MWNVMVLCAVLPVADIPSRAEPFSERSQGNAIVELETPTHTLGLDAPTYLYRVTDVAISSSRVTVLTRSFPAISVFEIGDERTSSRSWGAQGQGPGELRSPTWVMGHPDGPLVLDMSPGASKLVHYAWDGAFRSEVFLRDTFIVPKVVAAEDGFLVQTRQFGGTDNAVVFLDQGGQESITAFEFESAATTRLNPPGGPRFGASPPFAPAPRWSVVRSREGQRAVLWDARQSTLSLHELNGGGEAGTWALPEWPAIEVTGRDYEDWLMSTFPQDFMSNGLGGGVDRLAGVRAEARDVFEPPEFLPAVLDLLPDPEAGIWVRKTTRAEGELWLLVAAGRLCGGVRFPAGRKAKAFGRDFVAALTVTSEADEEVIELYDRRAVACN